MELPKRKKIRLEGYDYSSCGAYFVTVCVAGRKALLWEKRPEAICPNEPDHFRHVGADIIRPSAPPLSAYGKIVEAAIQGIPKHYDNIVVDKYCIMPDHIHILVFILPQENGANEGGRMVSAPTGTNEGGRMVSAPALPVIIGSMKRWSSKQIGSFIWQKSFYDRVIRNEQDYLEAWQYMENNPLRREATAE